MKKIYFSLIFICILCISFIMTLQAQEKENIPPGMEVIEIGNVKHIVPIGTKVSRESGIIKIEGHSEYIARRFSDIEERIKRIEQKLEEITKVLDRLPKE